MENLSFPFPHIYKPHNIPIIYKEEPISLTPEQEQVWNAYVFTSISDTNKQPILNYLNKVMEGVIEIDDLENVDVSDIREYLRRKIKGEKERFAIVEDRVQKLPWSSPFRMTLKSKNDEIFLPVGE